jgi:hypothetical protein
MLSAVQRFLTLDSVDCGSTRMVSYLGEKFGGMHGLESDTDGLWIITDLPLLLICLGTPSKPNHPCLSIPRLAVHIYVTVLEKEATLNGWPTMNFPKLAALGCLLGLLMLQPARTRAQTSTTTTTSTSPI